MSRADASPRRIRPLGVIAGLAGLALVVYAVRRAGPAEIVEGVRRLGAGFVAVLLVSAVRDLLRTLAWQAAIEGDRPLPVMDGWAARITGEALGNLTPLGMLVSEPTKAAYVRHRVPFAAALAGTVIENLLYSLSVAVVIVAGVTVLLLGFPVPAALRSISLGALTAFCTLGAVMTWLVARRPMVATTVAERLQARGLAPVLLGRWIERIRLVETQILGFASRHPGRALRMALLHGLFHAAAIAEVWIVLAFISERAEPTVLTAFVLESVNRIVTVAFKFVPLRLGVDEAASGFISNVLQLGTAAGVTLAIVRKARLLCWAAVGVGLIAMRNHRGTTRNDHGRAAEGPWNDHGMTEMADGRAIAIMARSPFVEIDRIKTRLDPIVPAADDRQALYLAFVRDTIAACRTLRGVALRLAHTPGSGGDELETLGVGPRERLAQRGEDLGARERAVFEDLFAQGFDRVVVIGSDLPTLPAAHLRAAFAALDGGAPLVLGPADDGGYYLIGLRRTADGAMPDLFTGIRWSTRHALEDTLRAATGARVDPAFVARWHDVDDAAGWRQLVADLARPELAREARHTAREVARITPPASRPSPSPS